MDAYERLSNTVDARGRHFEIIKLHRPPPLFRTYKEASDFKVRPHQSLQMLGHDNLLLL